MLAPPSPRRLCCRIACWPLALAVSWLLAACDDTPLTPIDELPRDDAGGEPGSDARAPTGDASVERRDGGPPPTGSDGGPRPDDLPEPGAPPEPVGDLVNPEARGNLRAHEPTLEVASDGTLYLGFAQKTPLMARTDVTTRYVARWTGTGWMQVGGPAVESAHNGGTVGVSRTDGLYFAAPARATPAEGSFNVVLMRHGSDGWAQVGGILDSQPDRFSILPSFASLADGSPVVGFFEMSPDPRDRQATSRVHVRRWDGSAWLDTASVLSAGSVPPAVAVDDRDTIFVAYRSRSRSQFGDVYVDRWTGSSWEHVGGTFLDTDPDPGRSAGSPSVAFDPSGQLVVAFVESGELVVKRFDGARWVTLGGSLNHFAPEGRPAGPRLTFSSDGRPVVAWLEGRSLNEPQQNVYVAYFDGTRWVTVADAPDEAFRPAGSSAVSPQSQVALAADPSSPVLYVAFGLGSSDLGISVQRFVLP